MGDKSPLTDEFGLARAGVPNLGATGYFLGVIEQYGYYDVGLKRILVFVTL